MPSNLKPSSKPKLLSPWRRRFQWLTSLLILLIPWIQPDGDSLLRLDVPGLSLHLFGQVLRIEELYIFLLFCLTFIIFFLMATLVFGRLWCGWACPQTTLNDLAEWFAGRLKLKVVNNRLSGSIWRKTAAQLFYLLLALLVAANLLWYFIEPQRFFSSMLHGQLSLGVGITYVTLTLIIYLDLTLLRRLMCKEFCPYGRVQTAIVAPGTLTLLLPKDEQHRCIKCNSCVRSCPMEIDIRNGYQVECINCGRCLDACRQIMHKRNQPGLIHYYFGADNRGMKGLLNAGTLLLGLLLIGLLTFLLLSIFTRAAASLKVSVSHTVSSRILKDGQQATFFNAWINNRSNQQTTYHLQARQQHSAPLTLKGQTEQIHLTGGKNQKLDYVLVSPATLKPYMVEFVLLNSQNQELATAAAQITPIGQ